MRWKHPGKEAWLKDMVEYLVTLLKQSSWRHPPIGFQQMNDVCLHASMAKNRRPGRTGFSPRSLVFGCDERLIASGLSHYLETPDDAAIQASTTDTAYKKSIDFRRAAMRSVVELDHSTKWSNAIKAPVRPEVPTIFLPGNQAVSYTHLTLPTNREV